MNVLDNLPVIGRKKGTPMKAPAIKIATVYSGELRVYLYSFFQDLGLETIYVPKSRLSFRQTQSYSSEEWCYSLKLFYYDMLKALDMRANVLVCPSYAFLYVLAPCKLSHVAEHRFEPLLKQATNKKFKYIVFNFQKNLLKLTMLNLLRDIGVLGKTRNPLSYVHLFSKAKLKLQMHDQVITKMREVRSVELEKGRAFAAYAAFLEILEHEQDEKKLKLALNSAQKQLTLIKINKSLRPKKIAIVGDLVSILAEFPCFDLENFISDKFGIEIFQPHTLYRHYFDSGCFDIKGVDEMQRKYKKYWSGGSDGITIKMIALSVALGVDGIIHLRNFGCTPEQMIVESVEQMKQDMESFPPFISISFDEHSNPEGIKTRIEAFCNTLLRSKK